MAKNQYWSKGKYIESIWYEMYLVNSMRKSKSYTLHTYTCIPTFMYSEYYGMTGYQVCYSCFFLIMW